MLRKDYLQAGIVGHKENDADQGRAPAEVHIARPKFAHSSLTLSYCFISAVLVCFAATTSIPIDGIIFLLPCIWVGLSQASYPIARVRALDRMCPDLVVS